MVFFVSIPPRYSKIKIEKKLKWHGKLFQSLLGILKSHKYLRYLNLKCKVSIPPRYSKIS